ncbi:MAG: S8 family serine peptidase, partial [Actinomycetota bacterium]|nr:S8 family serine peptidase [Actinomycetota bacterium]
RATAAPAKLTQPGWAGAFAVADRAVLAPEGAGRFELVAAEAIDLRITVSGDEEARARVNDVTTWPETMLAEPMPGSTVTVHLAPLARIAIELGGASAELEAVEPTDTTSARSAPARLVPIERERAALGLATGDLLYGRTPSNVKVGDVLVKPRASADVTGDLRRRGLVRTDGVGEDVLQLSADLEGIASPEERTRTTVALARSLNTSPRVEYAELNRIRRTQGGPFSPTDAHFPLQWHYPLVRLPEAWDEVGAFITGPGPDVVVAVIDTGRRPHPDLDDNTISSYEFDFITSTTIAQDGNGPDTNATDEGDSEGVGPSSFHGTHVAGTIAAVWNNGLSVAGAASVPIGPITPVSRVRVVHLRVLGQGGGTDADIARAVRYAAGLSNPGLPLIPDSVEVINMSLGGPGFNQTMQNAVTAARNNGITVFAAAGNENSGTASFPAAYADVVSVAAVDHNSVRSPYSNFGASVDLCAPGGDTSIDTDGDGYVDGVLSTLVDQVTFGEAYVFYQGTSMACPHAAALAALMKIVTPTLSPAEVETKLMDSATDLGAPGRDNLYGEGLINALLAVQQAGTGGSATPLFAVNPTILNFGSELTQLPLSLLNLGGGQVDVLSFTDDQPWLTLINGGAGNGIDIGSLTVTIDRSDPGLAAVGTHNAVISIDTDQIDIQVPVVVVVGTIAPPDVDLFVLAVDLSGPVPVTVAEAVVNPTVDLGFVLNEMNTADGLPIPPGFYLIACGSDDNGDFIICGDSDIYCGLYPTLNEPELVFVNGEVRGISFVVAPESETSPQSTTGATHGFRRLGR